MFFSFYLASLLFKCSDLVLKVTLNSKEGVFLISARMKDVLWICFPHFSLFVVYLALKNTCVFLVITPAAILQSVT